MKRFYQKSRWLTYSLFLGLLVCANMISAQVAQTWTGASSDNFRIEENWDPAGSPAGNNLTLPLIQYDSIGNLLSPNATSPVLSGSEDLTVKFIYMTGTTVDTLKMRNLTINLDPTATLYSINGGSKEINYSTVNVVLNSGNVYFDNYERFQENYRSWTINGGSLYCSRSGRTMQIGNANNPTTGGQFIVNGGLLYIRGGGLGRALYTREGGQFIIKNDGVIKMDGDKRSYQQYIESGWINGGDDFYPVMSYDALTNVTTFVAVPATTVMLNSTVSQELLAGVSGDVLQMILTPRVKNAKSIAWKYTKTSGSGYTAFEGADSTSFAPVFSAGGTYYVIAEIVDADGVTAKTSEVMYSVISDAIAISPVFDIQYIRVGEAGTKLTAEFKDGKVPTSMEWKYSTVLGGTYVPFTPAQTSATINPVFNVDTTATGISYYVLLEATIDGKVVQSANLQYAVDKKSTTGREITWTGLISTDAKDPGNWTPVASHFKNNLTINALTGDAPNYPVLTMTGNDTITSITINAGATFAINQGRAGIIDTMNFRNTVYVNGQMDVDNVMIDYTSYFWRLPASASRMNMTGDASLSIMADYNGGPSLLSMGNNDSPTYGGYLDMKDNSRLYMRAFHRMMTAKNDSSVIALDKNAEIWFQGDGRATIKTYIDSTKIRCSTAGYEPYILYPYKAKDTVWTVVISRDASSFSVADDSRTFTTAGYPTADEIGLTNVDGVTSWEWKWSTSVNGPWNSFSTPATDLPTYAPSFDAAGDYYVIAETSTGVQTSNMKQISVIDLSVTPGADQNIALDGVCDSLYVTIPTEVTMLSGGWFYYDEDGNENETGVDGTTFLPYFETVGVYQVYFYAEVQDENSVSYDLLSNTVTITVGDVAVKDFANSGIKMYPNPAKEYINLTGLANKANVKVFNAVGQQVAAYASSNSARINLTGYSKGIYMLKVEMNDQTYNTRFIKE